jgi:acyl carrier protein
MESRLKTSVEDDVRVMAGDLFSVPAAQIHAESSPETIANWDSVQHLSLVLAVEEKFGVQFSPEEIEKMRTIGEITKLIELKLQSI